MKCPSAECLEGFVVTHKAYVSSYQHKKNNKKIERPLMAPRWQLASITNHFKKAHFMNISVNDKSRTAESSDDTESHSNLPKDVEDVQSNEFSEISDRSEIRDLW